MGRIRDWFDEGKELLAVFGIALGAIVVLTTSLVFVVNRSEAPKRRATRLCLRAGYAETKLIDGEAFCVRRVNGTDEVVPLARAGGVERAP